MELLGQCNITLNFYASLHTRSNQIAPSFNHFHEIPLITNDRAVGIPLRFLHADGSIVHGNKPASHLVNIKKIGSMDTAQMRLVLLQPVNVEYFLGSLWHLT